MSPDRSPALIAYRAATGLLEPLAPLWLARRAARGKEDSARLPERLARDDAVRAPGRLLQLHGASVGESLSLLPLAEAIRERAPDVTLLLTSGTVTSAALLSQRAPPGAIHRYAPLDLPAATLRFATRWRPDVAVFGESEVWPNLLTALRRQGARTALLSARLSDASLRGWTRAPAAARALFGGFDLVMAQDDATAAGLASLGARDDGRLNLKLAGDPPPVDGEALRAMRQALGGRAVWLAASTHPGEEEIVLDAFARAARAEAVLVIVPRHPERGPAVAALARARGFAAGLRSAGDAVDGAAPVHVADTLGELGTFYALASGALVGGSLVAGVGGHNPLEPLRLERPAATGPHVENWRSVYDLLGDAVPVAADAEGLARAFTGWVDDPEAARARTARGRERAEAAAGDVGAVAERLLALIP